MAGDKFNVKVTLNPSACPTAVTKFSGPTTILTMIVGAVIFMGSLVPVPTRGVVDVLKLPDGVILNGLLQKLFVEVNVAAEENELTVELKKPAIPVTAIEQSSARVILTVVVPKGPLKVAAVRTPSSKLRLHSLRES